MGNPTRPAVAVILESSGTVGLFRTSLAGPGRTLPDAFSKLEHAPLVERVTRHFSRDLLGARIVLGAEEGRGYWDFTRIRNECYVVVQNYAYREPRVELMGGDGLIQFNFRLSGDLPLGVSRQQPVRLTGPSLFVWQQPLGLEVPEWTAANAHEHSVSISIRPEFLVKSIFRPVWEVAGQYGLRQPGASRDLPNRRRRGELTQQKITGHIDTSQLPRGEVFLDGGGDVVEFHDGFAQQFEGQRFQVYHRH